MDANSRSKAFNNSNDYSQKWRDSCATRNANVQIPVSMILVTTVLEIKDNNSKDKISSDGTDMPERVLVASKTANSTPF